jgi:two-component system response regulator RegA
MSSEGNPDALQARQVQSLASGGAHEKRLGRVLIVDDDERFCRRLAQSMERRGFEVMTASGATEAEEIVRRDPPAYAVVDLRLEDGSGLDVVQTIRNARNEARVIILTGYGNIATAVAAVKAGAVDYLPKPADADQVAAALLQIEESLPPPPEHPMSADRVRWEHIQRVYEQCDRNVSETARRLRMHRRTLQRILAKYAPRD